MADTKSVQFIFRGLMCPVFTPFHEDKQRNVNYGAIDKYAMWLKQKGVTAVLVNGTTGEGTTLRLDERTRITEIWLESCRKHQMLCMTQIGGTNITEVFELAAHAERISVDAVLCLPDLFFKPVIEQDLVAYIKEVAQYCPTRPMFYYHIPMFTSVQLYMPCFCDLAEKEIPSFCGLKYTNGNMEDGVACLKNGRTVFLGADTILTGAMSLGFDCAILTTLNLFPEYAIQIFEYMRTNKWQEARTVQNKMNKRIWEICPRGADWVETMKTEFNRTSIAFKAGPCRKPLRHNAKH